VPDRLSPLDASFLAVEGPEAHMHVGWVAYLEPPRRGRRPDAEAIAGHIAARLERAPRWHQMLAPVPFGLHEPEWVDAPGFDPLDHLHPSDAADVGPLVDAVLSRPLDRARPLWEMWIADRIRDGRIAVVGKAHHCMVDGVAALELASVLLDREPGASELPPPAPPPAAAPPGAAARLAGALEDRAREQAALLGVPLRLLRRSGLPAAAHAAAHAAASLARATLPPAPASVLNRPGSADRRLACTTRPLDDLRAIRKRWGVTVNDVVLAACAGALRAFDARASRTPKPLKAMVPVDVRAEGDDPGGNRISFLLVALPCQEPDPVVRLMLVHREMATRELRDEAGDTDALMRALALAPRPLRRAAARVVTSPRMYNLAVSSIPGPRLPVHLAGCRLVAIHPVVPLAGRHALSVGMCTVGRDACFGLYADRATLPDAAALAGDLDAAIDELLAA